MQFGASIFFTEYSMSPAELGIALEDPELLKRYRDLGIARVTVRLPAAKADAILPILDRWTGLIRQVGG